MKVHDISDTLVVRRFGTRGARLFGRLWFSLVYAVFVSAEIAILSFAGWLDTPGLWTISLASLIIIIGVALVTKMQLEYWHSIHELERQSTTHCQD